jgi:small ligand-binding sensory domain FIST
MLKAGVGLSTATDGAFAAAEAVERAAMSLGERPDLCIAFVTGDHADDLPDILSTLTAGSGTPYVVGCSAAGVVAEGREIEDEPAVGVLALASDSMQATPFLFRDTGDQGLTAGIHLGQRLIGSRGSDDLLLVWPDPYRMHPGRLLHGLDATLGGVAVAGGASSSSRDFPATFQFSGREMSSAAVSGVRIGGRVRSQVVVAQGCRPVGEPMRVTRADRNLLQELDGRPALDRLREVVPEELFDDPQSALLAVSVALLPENGGTALAPGEYLVRNIVAADLESGTLGVADFVEEGQSVVFAVREPESARAELARSLAGVGGNGDAGDWAFGLYFDCVARGRSLYGRPDVDAGILSAALPGLPILGFFCNAEIAPLRGANHLFTYTGVLVLVGA